MTIAIFGNWYKRSTLEEVAHVLDFMESRGVNILLAQELRDEMNLRDKYQPFTTDTEEYVDFALSIGGDGTFLYTASMVGNRDIPILGINCGRLGFLADVQTSEVDFICDQLVQNNYTIEQRTQLQVIPSLGGHIEHPFALNEIAVMKQELSSMIGIEARVNGELLNYYKADGLVISTPTGSTAYNLSVGGPLMIPQTRSLIISPIATHALNVRPIVIPDDWKIDLVMKSRSHSYLLSIDGRSVAMKEDITLHIEKAPYTIKLVQIDGHTFLNSLKEKLAWGN
ncbi:MAG: NAD kinase [Paludibacteraceae bacterium]|nr:NAD kinase [Paludibacteraceae bacterium]